MRIINRRSQVETVITKQEWEQMVEQQVHLLFKVLDKSDSPVRTRINIPKVIEEFRVSRDAVNPKDLKIETEKPIKK
jgi:hypothetical protein